MDLSQAEHKLVIEQITLFEQSDQDTKNVGIRDVLINIFAPYMIPMRLLRCFSLVGYKRLGERVLGTPWKHT